MNFTGDFILMVCREGCGACCIAISISSPLPGMPEGKKAGERCIHLDENNICLIHNKPDYPLVCKNLKPSREMCGDSYDDAYNYLVNLENLTKP
jgi:Fe-S-cluster containining protein